MSLKIENMPLIPLKLLSVFTQSQLDPHGLRTTQNYPFFYVAPYLSPHRRGSGRAGGRWQSPAR